MSPYSTQSLRRTWPADSLVLIVDDEPSIRNGLARLFRSVQLAVETFASAKAYLSRPPHHGPTCLILDVRMPGLNGLELQRTLSDQSLRIIFLTGFGDVSTCAEAMKAGAIDFLSKPVRGDQLLEAVERALTASARWQKTVADYAQARAHLETLTPREREVMDRVVSGLLNKQIADELGAALRTIKIHRPGSWIRWA